MTHRPVAVVAFAAAACLLVPAAGFAASRAPAIVSVPFVPNAGQLEPGVAFLARTAAGPVFVTRDGRVVHSLPAGGEARVAIAERLVGARLPVLKGTQPAVTRVNDLRGDPLRFRTDLPTYRAVSLGEAWPGIEVSLHARHEGVEKVFRVAPGARVERIALRVDGARSLAIQPDGALRLAAGEASLRLTPPVAWQETAGLREPVEVAYRVTGAGRYGFTLGDHDRSRPVFIDPLLQSTYLGGTATGGDLITAMAIAPAGLATAGQVYVAGTASSMDFPGTVGGAQSVSAGTPDAFVARYDPDLQSGALLSATYLGTSAADSASALAIAADGTVFVAGTTGGPLRGQPFYGGTDAFLARLTPTLGAYHSAGWPRLVSTNGASTENVTGSAVAIGPADGKVYLAGTTFGAIDGDPASAGGSAFVAKFDPSGTPGFVLIRGTSGTTTVAALAVDASRYIFFTGSTTGSTYGGATPSGGRGAFIDAIQDNNNGTYGLRGSTLVDGNLVDEATALAIAPGRVWIAGRTTSTNGSFAGNQGGQDAFLAIHDYAAQAFARVALRLLGGTGTDEATALALAPDGTILVGGSTTSPASSMATVDSLSIQPALAGAKDGFLARLDANGNWLRTTYLGGSGADRITAMALAADGTLFVAGATDSTDFPETAGGAMAARPDNAGGFIANLSAGLTEDDVPPDTLIAGGPAQGSLVPSPGATFTFTATEAQSTFQCRLDGAAFAACASPATYAGLADGAHAFEVRAIDPSGNVDASPAARSWTVDATAPQTYLLGAPAALTAATEATFSFNASEAAASFECRLDGAAFAPCASPATVGGLAPGGHTFEVRAIDAAGNLDATPATHAFTVIDGALDPDGDGIPSGVELAEGTDPYAKDNDVFANARLFAMQQYRDFLYREGDAGGVAGWAAAIQSGAFTRPQAIEFFLGSPEFSGVVAPVVRLYYATFLRVPDYAGLTYNAGLVRHGAVSLQQLADFFVASPEFAATYGALDDTQFVTRLYNNVLGRAPEPAGLAGWVAILNGGASRGSVLIGFSESPEYKANMANEVLVTMMYAGMLRRTPESAGYNGWLALLRAGIPATAMIEGFFLSAEYRGRFL